MLPESKTLYPTVQKILESMKVDEKVSVIVQPAYFIHCDKQIRNAEHGYPEIDEDELLFIDVEVLKLQPVQDLYRDNTTFVQTMEEGNTGSTASPFNDCKVLIKLKLEIDGNQIYSNLSEDKDPLWYDLEEFQMPAVLKKTLKQTKLNEIV